MLEFSETTYTHKTKYPMLDQDDSRAVSTVPGRQAVMNLTTFNSAILQRFNGGVTVQSSLNWNGKAAGNRDVNRSTLSQLGCQNNGFADFGPYWQENSLTLVRGQGQSGHKVPSAMRG